MMIANVLGEEKEVTQYYGDGSYDCPHCHYPVRADEGLGPCRNPWCLANPGVPVEWAKKQQAEWTEKAQKEAERRRNHELAMERIAEWKQVEGELRTEKLERAKAEGYCLRCLVKSSFRKQVRHRHGCTQKG